MKTDLRTRTLAPIRRVIGLPMHRAHRPVDAPSLGPYVRTIDGGYVEGRHRRGLAEVFRRSFNAAIAERADRLNAHPSDQSEM